jgi:hypothetical protein
MAGAGIVDGGTEKRWGTGLDKALCPVASAPSADTPRRTLGTEKLVKLHGREFRPGAFLCRLR